MKISLPWHWHPRKYQEPLWRYLSNGGKRASVAWHRRAGKDELCLHHAACAMHERVGNVWHMLPEAAQARKAIWQAVNPHTGRRRIDEAFPREIREGTYDHEMMIRFKNGSTWQLCGSDNYNSLVGSSPSGIVFSEYALANPASWAYLRPILLENDGWALFISTPRGNNHFKQLHTDAAKREGWFCQSLTNDDTGVFTPEQMAEELSEMQTQHGEEYGLSFFRQEYFVSFDAAIMGSIWGDCVERAQRDGRIVDFDVDPEFAVSTAWDLGRTDDTSIWFFQMIGKECRIIDHHSSNGKDIPFYADLLRKKQKEHGIVYQTHWLPQDARPRTLAGGGKSILQQFTEESARSNVGRFAIQPRLDRQEGIQAARATFPICVFHKTRTEQGVESLRQYHREWDDESKKFTDNPVHDWSSHDADSFRGLSLVWKFARLSDAVVPLKDQLMRGSIQQQTFGQLKNAFLAKKRDEREMTMH